MSKNDWRCATCNGQGGVAVSIDRVTSSAQVWHETPLEVLAALRDSMDGKAIICCPDCDGTGEAAQK